MSFVADVVNRQDDWHRGMERRRVGRGVNQIDARTPRRARKTNGHPSEVRRRVPWLGHVPDSLGQRRLRSAEGDELEWRAERLQCGNQFRHIAADAGRG
jgi:hypothetical protein